MSIRPAGVFVGEGVRVGILVIVGVAVEVTVGDALHVGVGDNVGVVVGVHERIGT